MKKDNRKEDSNENRSVYRHRFHLPSLLYRPFVRIGTIAVILLIIIMLIVVPRLRKGSKVRTSIVSTSSLEKILEISDLSTYKAVYNGVADVKNAKGDKVLYHVSYESEVKVGFDADQIKVSVDDDNKKVIITLPEIRINDVTVKMESLDYIFEDNSANTSNVSKEAYQACIEDVKSETASNDQIFELARANSENLIKALVEPLLTQPKDTYTLEIN